MRKNLLSVAIVIFSLLFFLKAKANDLPKDLQREVIEKLEAIGTDSWEEGNLKVKLGPIIWNSTAGILEIHYRSRIADQRTRLVERPICFVEGINSTGDIIEVAENGYRSLSEKISDKAFECID